MDIFLTTHFAINAIQQQQKERLAKKKHANHKKV